VGSNVSAPGRCVFWIALSASAPLKHSIRHLATRSSRNRAFARQRELRSPRFALLLRNGRTPQTRTSGIASCRFAERRSFRVQNSRGLLLGLVSRIPRRRFRRATPPPLRLYLSASSLERRLSLHGTGASIAWRKMKENAPGGAIVRPSASFGKRRFVCSSQRTRVACISGDGANRFA